MSFTRQRMLTSGPGTVQSPYQLRVTASNGSYTDYTYSFPGSYSYKKTVGENIPDYHRRKAAGELLPHTDFYQWEGESYADGYCEKIYGSQSSKVISGRWTPYDGWMVSEGDCLAHKPDASSVALAVQRAAGGIAGSFDALTFAAEANKTAKMFKGVVDKMTTMRSLLKHPGLALRWAYRDPKYAAKSLTGTYLEGRYGWRPLVYDLERLHTAVKEFDSKKQRYSKRAGLGYNNQSTSTNTWDDGECYITKTITTTATVGVRGSVTADIEPPQYQFDPTITAWELIPYSFVVDWLVHVGDALEALRFQRLANNYAASGGWKITVRRNSDWRVASWKSGFSGNLYQRANDCYGVLTSRAPTGVSTIPIVSPQVTVMRGVDSLALIAQRLLKGV